MLKKTFGLVSSAALMFAFAYGCSSSTNSGTEATDASTATDSSSKGDGGSAAKDSGGGTTTTDGGNGGSCVPGDVSSFAPSWRAPAAFNQKLCTNAQVEALVGCVFDSNADQTACKALNADKSNAPCQACLLTSASAPKPGPILIENNVGSLNIAGCIANFDGNTTATGCGASVQSASDCESAACQCDQSDAAALKAFEACQAQAASGACSKYAQPAKTCSDPLLADTGKAADCNGGNTFLEAAVIYGKLFCAAGLSGEGGADAPSDG